MRNPGTKNSSIFQDYILATQQQEFKQTCAHIDLVVNEETSQWGEKKYFDLICSAGKIVKIEGYV